MSINTPSDTSPRPGHSFLPISRMIERVELAREESDTAYFFDLLYFGEMALKLLTVEVLTALLDDRERHRYALEYKLVRADGLGEWAEALDESLTGPASQHILVEARDSQRALTMNVGPKEEVWQRQAVDLLNKACKLIDDEVDDTSRIKVSMRQWFRQFVWLRNRTRGHGAPKLTLLADICPLLRMSLDEVVGHVPAFGRPWAFVRQKLSRSYRVSSFGGDRANFTSVIDNSQRVLPDGAYIFFDKPRRASLLFSDADLTDFLLPNGNHRSKTFEVLSYITGERRTEDGSKYTLPATAQPESETAASRFLEVVGEAFTNMPPRREGYVSRSTLEDELADLLRDDRHPVITLQGRGGTGKTSLALEVLHEVAEDCEFFAIVWFSARDIDLLPEGPKVVQPDILSADDIARDFINFMDPGSAAGNSKEAKVYLTDCLSGASPDGPFLFVLDNFETVRDPLGLYSWLSNAVRLPNKVLITTRARDFKADYPVEVGGFNRTEYATLVNDVTVRLGIRDIVDTDYEEILFEESAGHPYITKVLLGDVAHQKRKISLKRIVAASEAMLDALFDRSYATLSPAAQRVFLTACGWRSLIPRVGLEAVLLRPGNERLDVDLALTELTQSSLVEVVRDPNEDASFVSVPLAAAEFGKKKLMTSPLKITIDADLELIHSFGVTRTTDLAQGLGPRIDRVVRTAARRAVEGKDIKQELAVIEYIASSYPSAWLTLADLHEEFGNIDAAIRAVNRYIESGENGDDGWTRLIRLYESTGDSVAEMHARLQLVEFGNPSFHELSRAAHRMNSLLAAREIPLDPYARRRMVHKLRLILEARSDKASATDCSRLAWLCMHDRDVQAAERWARKGVEQEPHNRYCQELLRRISNS